MSKLVTAQSPPPSEWWLFCGFIAGGNLWCGRSEWSC